MHFRGERTQRFHALLPSFLQLFNQVLLLGAGEAGVLHAIGNPFTDEFVDRLEPDSRFFGSQGVGYFLPKTEAERALRSLRVLDFHVVDPRPELIGDDGALHRHADRAGVDEIEIAAVLTLRRQKRVHVRAGDAIAIKSFQGREENELVRFIEEFPVTGGGCSGGEEYDCCGDEDERFYGNILLEMQSKATICRSETPTRRVISFNAYIGR